MAEAVFQKMVSDAGLEDQFVIDSAGTSAYHVGQRPHAGTLKILTAWGIPYQGRARQFVPADLDEFDYVLAMDNENLEDILAMGPGKAHVARLLDYAPEVGREQVPDPFYDGGFQLVYDLVVAGGRGLLAHIRQENQLQEA